MNTVPILHATSDTQALGVDGDSQPLPATSIGPIPKLPPSLADSSEDGHSVHAVGESHHHSDAVSSNPAPTSQERDDAHPQAAGWGSELRAWSRMLDDIEQVRMACDQRISALEREHRLPDAALTQTRDELAHTERVVTRQVTRAYRATNLYPFTHPIPGIGDKLMGRLIAETGNPATRPNPAKFLAYCGCGDPNLKRRRGMTQEDAFRLGSPKAKAILLNPTTGIAAQIVRHRPEPYRSIYDDRKARYEQSQPDWPQLRRDRAARKIAVKRFLIDLWAYSRDAA